MKRHILENRWIQALRRSLKTRVTLSIVAIFLLCLWSLYIYLDRVIRDEVRRQVMEQQVSIATLVSTEIKGQIEDRLNALQRVAGQLGPLMDDKNALQIQLEQRLEFQDRFNGGVFVTDVKGLAMASLPLSAQRVGVSYSERDYFQMAIAKGQPVVGTPVMGKQLHVPIFGMAAPIRDRSGVIVGTLVGIINLVDDSFLDKLISNHYGQTGGYFLVSRSARLVVTATNKSRVMTAAAQPGYSPLIDRFMNGEDGSGLTVNSMGQEVLVSARSVPSTDWFLAVSMPSEEAFSLIHSVQRTMLLATLFLSICATVLVWLILRRQLAPLTAASQILQQRSVHEGTLQPLPVVVEDEIGALIGGFNNLLQSLQHRETELQIAATAFESQEGIFVSDANWVILKVNRAFSTVTGYAQEEAIGRLPKDLLGSDQQAPAFYESMAQRLETQGSWQGEVWDRRKDGRLIPVWLMLTTVLNAEGAVSHYVGSMVDISERKQAEIDIRNLAFYDPLTGLPNRRLLMDRLNQAISLSNRHQRLGALLFLDLDNFKDLNDTLGHDQGDRLLTLVAQRLSECVREGDTVARLGGDEFVVMLLDLSADPAVAIKQAEHVGEKILDALNQPYALADGSHSSTPSIGVTVFGEKAEHVDELLKRADLAMYQAKSVGRNTMRLFDAQMQADLIQRASMEVALRAAIDQNQLVLHYQPQVDGEGRCIGVESLVRWQHPERGLVYPGEFIPVAEHSGLIIPLGQWVLESACAQIVRWSNHPERRQLTIAVNVSALQLMQPNFVPFVLQVLETTGADPQRLKLELTESLLVSDVNNTIAKMLELKAHGVGFSLDDFGTGYSSLTFLKRLPLDQLKIDQSFVRDILVDSNDAAIAKMIIALGKSLNLSVIAEGVETHEQRAYLAELGCYVYQGYLFGRPMESAAIESMFFHPGPA